MQIIDSKDKKWIHYVFVAGIISKGVNAILEIIGGAWLYFFSGTIIKIVVALTAEELSEDPRDKIAQFLLQTAQHLSLGDRLFGSIYLLSHGIIKLGLVVALLKRKLWAYPLAIIVFGLFIVYQIYRFTYNHSLWLIVLSFVDVAVIVATWLEYKRIKSTTFF